MTKREKQEKPTTKPTDIGMNRTGIATSPVQAKAMREAADEGCGEPSPEAEDLTQARARRPATRHRSGRCRRPRR